MGIAVNYPDFSSTTGIAFTGSAAKAGSVLRVTPSSADSTGDAWYTTLMTISSITQFSTHFTFTIVSGSGSGDGFTFTLNNGPNGTSSLGAGTRSLGFDGIRPSFALTFHTTQHINGWVSGNCIGYCDNGDVDTQLAQTDVTSIFDIGAVTNAHCWIDYDAVTMKAYLSSSSTKPDSPTLSLAYNLSSGVGTHAYPGFTAATGTSYETHDITSWTMTSSEGPPGQPASKRLGGVPFSARSSNVW